MCSSKFFFFFKNKMLRKNCTEGQLPSTRLTQGYQLSSVTIPFSPEYVMSKSHTVMICWSMDDWAAAVILTPKIMSVLTSDKVTAVSGARNWCFPIGAHRGKEPGGTCLALNSTVPRNVTEVDLWLYLLFCMTFPAQIDHIRLYYSAERVTVLHEVHQEPLHGNIVVRMGAFVF